MREGLPFSGLRQQIAIALTRRGMGQTAKGGIRQRGHRLQISRKGRTCGVPRFTAW
jgi:hypothetical protein